VEVKHNWETGPFKYSTVHISARKDKYNNAHHMHVTMNSSWTHYLIVPPSALAEAKRVIKNTSVKDFSITGFVMVDTVSETLLCLSVSD
jgi:hypothetical protein